MQNLTSTYRSASKKTGLDLQNNSSHKKSFKKALSIEKQRIGSASGSKNKTISSILKNTNKDIQILEISLDLQMANTNLNEEKSIDKTEKCLLHSRPAELICIDDEVVICSNCALFGSHKGHYILDREGIMRGLTEVTQKCLDLYEKMQQCNNEYGQEGIKKQCLEAIDQKKNSLQAKINSQYQDMIKSLKSQKNTVLQSLQKWYKQKLQAIQQKIQIDSQTEFEERMKAWYASLEQLGHFMQLQNNSLQSLTKAAKYIGSQMQGQAGYKLSQKDNQTYMEGLDLIQIRQQIGSQILMQFKKQANEIDFISRQIDFQNCFQLKFEQEPSKLEFSKQDDDNLLISVTHNQESSSIVFNHYPISILPAVPYIQPTKKYTEEVKFDNIPHLSISDIRAEMATNSNLSSERSRVIFTECEEPQMSQQIHKSQIIKQDHKTDTSMKTHREDEPLTIPQSQTKKRKKIGQINVPQKFRGIIEDLKNDRAEVVDLTNAELTDSQTYSLCHHIAKSQRLKLLKLVKNKLTDNCLQQLLKAMFSKQSGSISLNLSQNLLTDKCISLIEKQLAKCDIKQNYALKNINLTMNKINRRNIKSKAEEITKKWGINLII